MLSAFVELIPGEVEVPIIRGGGALHLKPLGYWCADFDVVAKRVGHLRDMQSVEPGPGHRRHNHEFLRPAQRLAQRLEMTLLESGSRLDEQLIQERVEPFKIAKIVEGDVLA